METFQILVKGNEAVGIVEEWSEKNIQCDIRLRRAKTKGGVIIELTDAVYANNIRRWHPGCKVAIKEEN